MIHVRLVDVGGVRGRCSYLLPIRRALFSRQEAEKFATYFQVLKAAGCEVIVIDGSPPVVFNAHALVWDSICRHRQVNRRFTYLNDKVNAIHTGIAVAANEKIILADDDVRYGAEQIELICERLEKFDVVRPQNFILPLPWWSRMSLMETLWLYLKRTCSRSIWCSRPSSYLLSLWSYSPPRSQPTCR